MDLIEKNGSMDENEIACERARSAEISERFSGRGLASTVKRDAEAQIEREEKTRNRAMAAVGDCTRAQYALLQSDPAVRASTLVWHPGGHFTDPDRRMAEGVAWIVRNCNR